MWLEKTAAEVRVICESCDKNFRLDALKFNIFSFLFACHSPNSIPLAVCSVFSGTTGRYCFRQNLSLTAQVSHQ